MTIKADISEQAQRLQNASPMSLNWRKWLRKARPGADGRARIGPRQIYILPTRYGLVFAGVVLLMVLGGLNYAANLALLLAFLLASVAVVGMLHTWRNLLGLELEAQAAPPVFAGDEAVFPVSLRETRGWRRPGLELRLEEGAGALSLTLPAGGGAEAGIRVPAPRRGRLTLPRLEVASRYPLGLVRAWSRVELPARTLVYPRPAERGRRHLEPGYRRARAGDKGRGTDDFVGLRPYRPGDPPSRLDWKALARERGLVVREFGGDREEEVWIAWENQHGDPEARLSAMCRALLEAAREGLHPGLVLPGRRIPPATGEAHRHRCLEALALYGGPRA